MNRPTEAELREEWGGGPVPSKRPCGFVRVRRGGRWWEWVSVIKGYTGEGAGRINDSLKSIPGPRSKLFLHYGGTARW